MCEKIGLPAGPINSIDRVFEDAQVQAREMRVTAQHSEDGDVPLLNSPLRIPTAPTSIRRAPPTLGEHTEEVLAEMFGLDAASVAALRQEGVV